MIQSDYYKIHKAVSKYNYNLKLVWANIEIGRIYPWTFTTNGLYGFRGITSAFTLRSGLELKLT